MAWIALLLAASAAAVGARWWLRRVDTLGRRQPFPAIAVGVCAVGALAAAVPAVHHSEEQSRLGDVASRLAGHRVSVHCQTFGETWTDAGAELGYVRWQDDGRPEPRTTIKYDQCRDLAAYLGSSKHAPTAAQVVAVHVLTHEAMHMRGLLDEAQAECAAVQRDATTAELLGASPGDAAALAAAYWGDVYPRMPDGYRTPECRPGGALDEGLDTAPW